MLHLKLALTDIMVIVFGLLVVYMFIEFMGGDKPLAKINKVVDAYEKWREGRLLSTFRFSIPRICINSLRT